MLLALYSSPGTATTPSPYTGPSGYRPRYRVRICDTDGSGYGELPSANIRNVIWRLNDADEANFTISTSDPAYQYLRFGDREVQVWRDGDIIFWGYPKRGQFSEDLQTLTVQAAGLWDYFRSRFVGDAERENKLTNPGFEASGASLTGWTTVNTTAAVETTITFDETRAAKLTDTDNAGYISQTFDYSHTFPLGLQLRTTFWFYIDTAATIAAGDTLLEVILTDPTDNEEYSDTFTVEADTLKGTWQRASVAVLAGRADTTYSIEVRLRSVNGIVYYDSGIAANNDAITVAYPGEDLSIMFRNLIQHAQDVNYGKDNLRIGTNVTATGTVELIGYPTVEHRIIADAVERDLVDREDGLDFWFEWTTTTRTARCASNRGTSRPEHRLEVGRQVVSAPISVDLSDTVTAGIVAGDAPDFTREEGWARDTSHVNRVFERVKRGPVGLSPSALDAIAGGWVAEASHLAAIPRWRITEASGAVIHTLEPGDTLPVKFDVGHDQIDGIVNHRITQITLTPGPETLDLDLAPAS